MALVLAQLLPELQGQLVNKNIERNNLKLCPFSKRVERKTLGTTDLSASPPCLGRSWNTSS